MARSKKNSSQARAKSPVHPMSARRRLEVSARFTDDVLAKLVDAFFQVLQKEGWGKRDLALVSGMNETAIGHILAGRRKNLKLETIAVLTRAMRTRPELVLHDLRPKDNYVGIETEQTSKIDSAAAALKETQVKQSRSLDERSLIGAAKSQSPAGNLREPEVIVQ
jgi:hypothetical protein